MIHIEKAAQQHAKTVVVLGAGPMGLAVAYQLMLDGYKPIIYEADDRVGGMSATFDFNGVHIERYYHFHCTSDKDFITLLDELGIADQLRWVKTKMGFWYQNRLQPWGNPYALLRFKGINMWTKIRYGLHVFMSTKRNTWHHLDKKNAVDWIKKWLGEKGYQLLWEPLFTYKFYHFTDNLSAAWIWSRIRRIGRSRYNIWSEKLGYLEGGSELFLSTLAQAIEAGGGEIHLNAPVQRVIIEKNRVAGIMLGEKIMPAQRVISTIPIPYVPKIIPDLPATILQAYQSLNNIAVVCVIVKLRRSVSPNFWVNIHDPEMDIPGIVEYTQLRSMQHTIVYVPFYMPGEHPKFQEKDHVFIEKVRMYLLRINPSLSTDDFLEIHASRYRFAQPICEPNFLKKLPPIALSVKNLWVADTSYYYPEDRGISESIGLGRKIARSIML